jgi:hypothetical protein
VDGIRVHLDLGPGLCALTEAPLTRDLRWAGNPLVEDFDLMVVSSPPGKRAVLSFRVEVAGVTLTQMSMHVRIGDKAERAVLAPVKTPSSLFASYSSADRDRVLDRVAAIRIATATDVFVDCLDLAPGRAWQARLEHEIAARDLFVLFWSNAAAMSKWVRWEYSHALEMLGADRMQIQPLENGVRAPRVLKHLHFADPLNDVREAALRRARRSSVAEAS